MDEMNVMNESNVESVEAEVVGITNTTEEVVDVEVSEVEPSKAIEDEENPINEVSIKQITQLLKQVEEMVRIMEANWNTSKRELKLTDTHMKQLYQYNEENRTEMPDDLSEEEQEKWDRFNGLNNITEEKVIEIFGENHPIIEVEYTVTVDRIKDATEDFFNWLSALQEYRQIHDAYLQLIELEEEKNIEILKTTTEKEEDSEKKAKMQESIDMYYNRKYLGFLAEKMDDKDRDRIIKAFSDQKKIEYWLQRTRDKLKQIKVAEKFILEISQFEKRFLDEKYEKCSNILLLYFMQLIIYSDLYDTKNNGRNKVVAMVVGLDGFIRKTQPKEVREKILNNVIALLDQFIDFIPNKVE